MLNEVFDETRERMDDTLEHLKREFGGLRTGRASTALLDPVRVDYYGSPTPIRQMASISVPEANLLVISPWDQNQVEPVERAIQKADLGLVPQSDGRIIRIAIPPLTEERRKEQVRKAKKLAEEGRIAVRNIRRDANDLIKDLQKEKEISEDQEHRAYGEIQKLTDEKIAEMDRLLKEKEKEILEL